MSRADPSVKELVRALDFRGSDDELEIYRELSQLSCDLSLLVSVAKPEIFDDYLTIWQWARGSGLFRRVQVLSHKLSLPQPADLFVDGFQSQSDVVQFEQHLRGLVTGLAEKHKGELLATAYGDALPVVDSESDATIYGWAKNRAEARQRAETFFVDPVERVYYTKDPVNVMDGTRWCGGAWVALAGQPA